VTKQVIDPEMMWPGARTAVRQCMAVNVQDRVFILTDDETATIGALLADESRQITPYVVVHRLEAYGQRPLTDVPEPMRRDIYAFTPTVFFYAAQSKPGEITFRIKLRPSIIEATGCRWGHMIGITPQLMVEGMRTDYHVISELTFKVTERVKNAREMHITSPKSTQMVARFSPALRWRPCNGLYHHPRDWGNLPEGETFTCPASIDGMLAADVLGDYFSHKYGVLTTPVIFHLQEGWVTNIECQDQAIADDVWTYLNSDPNGRRAGEFAIGTNIGLKKLSGNLLQDEKLPGVHVAFGNPYPEETGADWTAKIHVDVIPTDVTIVVDGETLMEHGEFKL
jgi:aminopeptidase